MSLPYSRGVSAWATSPPLLQTHLKVQMREAVVLPQYRSQGPSALIADDTAL